MTLSNIDLRWVLFPIISVFIDCTGATCNKPAAPRETPLATAQPAASSARAESMRQFFAARGLIADPRNGGVQSDPSQTMGQSVIQYIADAAASWGCKVPVVPGLATRPTPSEALAYYELDFVKHDWEGECAQSPNRMACLAIRNNCLAVESSIFCDITYLARAATVAELLFFNAYVETNKRLAGQAYESPLGGLSTEDMLAVLDYQQGLISEPLGPLNEKIGAADSLKDCTSSALLNGMFVAAAGVILTHEFAHVEPNFCPGNTRMDRAGHTRDRIKEYGQLECLPASFREAAADMRGNEIAVQLLGALLRLAEDPNQSRALCGPSGDDPEEVREHGAILSEMTEQASSYIVMSAVQAAEYDLVAGKDFREARAALVLEPRTGIADLRAHWAKFGAKRPASGVSMGHLIAPYRHALYAEALGYAELVETWRREKAHTTFGARFSGVLTGELDAVRGVFCTADKNGASPADRFRDLVLQ